MFRIVEVIGLERPIVRDQVFVTRTRAVPDRDIDAVCSGIRLIQEVSRASLNIRDLRDWGISTSVDQPYMSLDWYQAQAGLRFDRGYGPQVDGSRMLYMSLDEIWQEKQPHLEAMIVDRDANMQQNEGYINYCFAVTMPQFGFVLSTARFASLPERDRFAVIRRTAAHEFGHVLGLVERDYNYEDSLGRHCRGEKGPCLMRQGLSLDVWLRQYKEEVKTGQELCPDCLDDLKAGKGNYAG